MKICTTICEYNPLHFGHIKHLRFINENLKGDLTAVFLSGNFVERGEPAVLDKYLRAVHAIKGGADIVFELPTVFATANAEIFASGAIKLISALSGEKVLCFGTEASSTENLYKIANLLNEEPLDFVQILKENLKGGNSFARARALAIKELLPEVNKSDYIKPNNVLGIEYIRAILKGSHPIKVENFKRETDYLERNLQGENSSALAIRTALYHGQKDGVKNAVPDFVYDDLKGLPDFSKEIIYSLINSSKEQLSGVLDCSEGLENKIKKSILKNLSYDELVADLKGKRYTETRIKRILLSTMLNISKDFVFKCLNSPLYLKVLAIKKEKMDALSYLSDCKFPIITRKSDADKLSGVARECFEKDLLANAVYSSHTGVKINGYEMKIV